MGLTGGCMCGAVRYELKSEPFDCGWCHCRTCQLNSGAPGMVFASVADGDFVWIEGGDKVKSASSSSFGHREFCGECGTPFLMKVDHQPETVDFSVVTLDDPEAIAPGFHIFWGGAGSAGSSRRTSSLATRSSGPILEAWRESSRPADQPAL